MQEFALNHAASGDRIRQTEIGITEKQRDNVRKKL